MTRGVLLLAIMLSCLFLTACASKQPPPPDPLKEEITILQRQHLDLQNQMNETNTKLEQALSAVDALSFRIESLEAKRTAPAKKRSSTRKTTKKGTRR